METTYPLPPGECASTWRIRALHALNQLSHRGLLPRDDPGGGLSRAFEALLQHPISTPLEASPGRTRLVGELLRNLADPARINQGLKGTCSVTCIESWLATSDPIEYARIVVGLCAPTGDIGLRGGGPPLQRDESFLSWEAHEDRRSPVSRLFQVACMQYAYPDMDYQNLTDRFVGPGTEMSTGIGLDAFDRLLEAITGERWDTLSEKTTHIARLLGKYGLDVASLPDFDRDGWGIIRASADAGQPTFVSLHIQRPDRLSDNLPHKVRVLSVQADRVDYDDPLDPSRPWIPGVEVHLEDRRGHCSMPADAFRSLVLEISYKPAFWSGA